MNVKNVNMLITGVQTCVLICCGIPVTLLDETEEGRNKADAEKNNKAIYKDTDSISDR